MTTVSKVAGRRAECCDSHRSEGRLVDENRDWTHSPARPIRSRSAIKLKPEGDAAALGVWEQQAADKQIRDGCSSTEQQSTLSILHSVYSAIKMFT
ncbi:hypothetical protein EYF80_010081 [Liparis tanakae]|uniref:Uncharacterized protein n=1 Tax=Liparis tanakae TaxID=230148 RepID=A0A4Z2IPH9_9TELE|nr:hypothetical protein EYF80_010081 [Liparis tanakae]